MLNTVVVEGNIIAIKYHGDQTEQTAKELHTEVFTKIKALRASKQKAYLLADLSDLGSHDAGSHSATVDSLKSLEFEKLAIMGASAYLRHIGNFILQAAGKLDLIRYVSNREEAASWFAHAGQAHVASVRTRKILIIDSDSDAQSEYRQIFDTQKYELFFAGSVVAAQTILSAEKPELMILDTELMGGQNGFDFLESLRKDEAHHQIPVLVYTNLEHEDKTAISLGADSYLLKKNASHDQVVRTADMLMDLSLLSSSPFEAVRQSNL